MINAIRKILDARMATWTTTPIHWANTPPLTGLNAAWVRYEFLPDDRFVPSTGSKRIANGFVAVQVFVPSGTGTGAAMTHADSVGALFANYKASGVICGEPTITPDGTVDGWYQVNVTIKWRAEV